MLCRHDDSVNSVDFHPNGRFLLSGGNDTVAIMWDLNKAQHVRLFSEQDTQVCAVKFAPNGLYCAVGSYFIRNFTLLSLMIRESHKQNMVNSTSRRQQLKSAPRLKLKKRKSSSISDEKSQNGIIWA